MNTASVLTPRTQQARARRAGSVHLCTAPTAPRFAVAQSRPGRDLAVAFGCAVAWALLWTLLLSAAFSPPGDLEVDAFGVTGYPSSKIDPPELPPPRDMPRASEADSCGGAMIEIDGSCVFGEDLEVRPPPGWSRR